MCRHVKQDWSFIQYNPTNRLYIAQKIGGKAHGTLKECRWRAGMYIIWSSVCICPLQAVNPGRSLFLLYALKSSPRLGLLYLYLFDYTDSFLPFIHTICPLQEGSSGEDILTKLLVGTWFLEKVILPYRSIVQNWREYTSLCEFFRESSQEKKRKTGPFLEASFIFCITQPE